jgi:hypothetical protein
MTFARGLLKSFKMSLVIGINRFASLRENMSLLDSGDLEEKQKLDKKLTQQKILLGAVLVDALEKDSLDGLREYTADNLLDFLSRQTDKDLMADLVKGLDTE